MTDHTLARADEVLIELVELVETARTVPMSSMCMIGREQALDLIDALREVMPPEMIQARQIVSRKDSLLADAQAAATEIVATATAQAEQLIAAAHEEQQRLVSAHTVSETAAASATAVREEADRYAESVHQQAEAAATRLRADAHAYADTTLGELLETLARLSSTASNGRAALGGDFRSDFRLSGELR